MFKERKKLELNFSLKRVANKLAKTKVRKKDSIEKREAKLFNLLESLYIAYKIRKTITKEDYLISSSKVRESLSSISY